MDNNELKNFVPLNRNLFKHHLWLEDRPFSKFEAWIDLIQSARFEEGEAKAIIGGKLVSWYRGEVPASLRFLAERWGWSKNKVDNFLNMLVLDNMIIKRTAKGTAQNVITLCNYDSYNKPSQKKGQQKGHDRDSTSPHFSENDQKTGTVTGTDEGQAKANTSTDLREIEGQQTGQTEDTGGTEEGQRRDKYNKEKNDKKLKKEIQLPFSSENFKSKWQEWKNFKAKELKFFYKSEESEQAALNELFELSQETEQTAIAIINQSLAKGWKGLFELKQTPTTNGKHQTSIVKAIPAGSRSKL